MVLVKVAVFLIFVFYQVYYAFEPFGEEDSILATAWFTKVSLRKAHTLSLFFKIFLKPPWYLLVFRGNAGLSQLVSYII